MPFYYGHVFWRERGIEIDRENQREKGEERDSFSMACSESFFA